MKKKIVLSKMVRPAIYNLEGHNWGWHKMKDLVKVVNNYFRPLGLKTNPLDLIERFWDIDGHLPCGSVWAYRGDRAQLRDCTAPADFTHDAYVAAGWGVEVVKMVRRSIVRVKKINGVIKAFDKNGKEVICNLKGYSFAV